MQYLADLCPSDGKRPDRLALIPWRSGGALVWDVTVVCPLADSYVASAAREARSVAELAATKKKNKYSGMAADYLFFSQLRSRFSAQLMNRLLTFIHFRQKSQRSGDERETRLFCLFQRVSALVQRYNSVLLHDSFVREDYSE